MVGLDTFDASKDLETVEVNFRMIFFNEWLLGDFVWFILRRTLLVTW